MNAAIEIDRLSLWYGQFQALRSIELAVAAGGVTALVGPSGCGKTTLLKAINRMHERTGDTRTTGSVRVHGHDVLAPEVSLPELRRRVGLVFQRPNPLPLSIYDNVAFAARLHERWSSQRLVAAVDAALARVGLADVDRRDSALSLSLEQQQRLCIARLLPLEPKLLLMDEPTSALDAAGTHKIETLIRELRGDFTVAIVTHSMGQARRISDACAFMLLGELVEHGPTDEIFAEARDQRTRDYLAGRFG
ncbi:MAG: phosphate ABC transporter ATP-binding protein [Deltaproteobacteria bacterium]|nr:phosphate ABC transporter ATP-binding protein [Nannocystaceae bacterium]